MTSSPERVKRRELVFTIDPPGQTDRAFELLKGLENLSVERGNQPNCLIISYSLMDYTLERLELALRHEGFRFDENALQLIGKTLTHYSEDVEYHNLNTPERPSKNREREIFIQVYDRHLHGDHDDTPPELREYK